MKIPKPVQNLIESFEKLPGIGPKTAQRLTYYLLHVPQIELDNFSGALIHLKKDTKLCSICKNISETEPCPICTDNHRDRSVIMVVEQPLDVLAFERTGKYNGIYHVLHGSINPLENIGPDEIFIQALIDRINNSDGREEQHKLPNNTSYNETEEIIIATNPTMEGDATAMYLAKKLKEINSKIKVTRLGMGIPTGADLEYADETTLKEAVEGRRVI